MLDPAQLATDISSRCPDLFRVLGDNYADVAMHYRKCHTCQTELRLFRMYSSPIMAPEVSWITAHLRRGPLWTQFHRARMRLEKIYRIEPVVAACLILITAPLAFIMAAVTSILSRRAPLIRHPRVGRYGSRLDMLKFRTMWGAASSISDSELLKSSHDPRVTSPFAAWCRRFSVDEIPQLIHVLRGQMSLVGPRPLTRAELDRFYGSDQFEVLSARPGITGLWQAKGRSRLSYRQRRRLDLFWIRHASPALYLRTLLRTSPRTLLGRDAF